MSDKSTEDEKIAITVVLLIVAAVVFGVLGFGSWKATAQKGLDAVAQSTASADAAAVAAAGGAAAGAAAGDANASSDSTNTDASAQAQPDVSNLADDATAIRIDNGVVKFYFAKGKADLDAGAQAALAELVKAAAAGKKIKISGFHDSTGSAAKNAELAKQRAIGVRAALVSMGVSEGAIELVKPEVSQGSGSNAEARRVEVSVVN
jgi:outer membrane protein OmpA-like peptidoglycan-associated protein